MDNPGIARRTGRRRIQARPPRGRGYATLALAVSAISITVVTVPDTIATALPIPVSISTAIAVPAAASISTAATSTIAVPAAVPPAIAIAFGVRCADRDERVRGSGDSQHRYSKQSRDCHSPGKSHAVRLFFAARLARSLQ
jgi:hypothetical protein